MKISGVKIPAGVTITAPTQEQPQAPSGPSKFVVGARRFGPPTQAGAAYIYNMDGTGEQKITASDGAEYDLFGGSVAIHGDKIVVGASGDDDSGSYSGSVYVYNLDGTGEQKITASDGAQNDGFGHSVAMTDTKIVVSALNDDDAGSNSGSVYVYNLDGTGEQKITASDGAGNDKFGQSVTMSDIKIVVSAANDDNSKGSVYVYNTDGTGEQKITASDGVSGNQFGESVAVSDTKVVVGSSGDQMAKGSVYVYNLDGTGEVKITASDGVGNDLFGKSVAVTDTHIVVGAMGDGDAGSGSGSAYVYNLDGTGEVKITASDGASGDRFGGAVYTDGQNIFVGAGDAGYPAEGYGSVYIYNMDGTGEQKIVPTISPAGGGFGGSIA